MTFDYTAKAYIVTTVKTLDFSITPEMALCVYEHIKTATGQFSNDLALPLTAEVFNEANHTFDAVQEDQALVTSRPMKRPTARAPCLNPASTSALISAPCVQTGLC